MPRKRLTEEGVARLKPPAAGRQVDYFDTHTPGLVLRANYGGAKIWRALYYRKRIDKDGKRVTTPTTHKLGRYPHLKLKDAREAARRFLADPAKGLAESDTGSFGEVAANFIKRHVEANKLRSQAEIERSLDKYVLPVWGHRPFREIRRGDVAALLDHIEDKHGARQADLVLAVVRKMSNWYAARNDDYVSPVVRGMHRSNASKGKRTLDDDEVRAVWQAAGDAGTFGALVKLLLLTGQRREKVATMMWNDLKGDEWTIRTEDREKGNAGVLRLPALALEIVAAQPRLAGNPYVFAGRGGGPINAFSQRKAELDAKLPAMPPFVLHDLRRTARSLLSRAGVRPDVAERVLGHAILGVEGVYDRHSYSDEKADALTRLAALVESIIKPPVANVIPLGNQADSRRKRE